MTLAKLKEEKREYKGLKSLVESIEEDFKELAKDFTPELVIEYIKGEVYNNTILVFKYENRLWKSTQMPYYMHITQLEDVKTDTEKSILYSTGISINDYNVKCIDGDSDYMQKKDVIPLTDFYIVQDYTELVKLEIQVLEEKKLSIIKDLDTNIDKKQTLITDLKKFNLRVPNDYKIEQLKAAAELKELLKTDVPETKIVELIEKIN